MSRQGALLPTGTQQHAETHGDQGSPAPGGAVVLNQAHHGRLQGAATKRGHQDGGEHLSAHNAVDLLDEALYRSGPLAVRGAACLKW